MAFQFSPKTVTDGLVLYLDAANTRSYPGTGLTWSDLSRSGKNGTLIPSGSGLTYNTLNGGSLVFDGTNDYVETNYTLPSSSNYSMSVWAKSSSSGINNRVAGNADSVNGLSGADIIWGYPTTAQIYCVRRNGANNGTLDTQSSSISNLLTGWHYVVYTYNTTTGNLIYVDGVQVGSNSNLGFSSSLTFRVGRDGNGTDAFNGNVSMVQIYTRTLSASEILQNFNATKSRFGL